MRSVKKQKAPRKAMLFMWLLDLGSNQGPTD
jgi:hypothetical protein